MITSMKIVNYYTGEMVPGDQIEWFYADNDERVQPGELLWSSIDEKYVPIGSSLVHTLISIEDDDMIFMNPRGIFKARTNDNHYLLGEVEHPVVQVRQVT